MGASGRKIEQVAEEADSLKLGLDKHLSRQHRRQADAQLRAELFQRTVCVLLLSQLVFEGLYFVTGHVTLSKLVSGPSSYSLQRMTCMLQNGEASRIIEMYDLESQARESVQSSSRLLEDITNTGIAVLGKYAEQRERLKVFSTPHRLCDALCRIKPVGRTSSP